MPLRDLTGFEEHQLIPFVQALMVVLHDKLPLQDGASPSYDAIFLHGPPILDEELDHGILNHAADELFNGFTSHIVLNGLTEAECRAKNLAYTGLEPWKKYLNELGVPDSAIVVLPPSAHTGLEDRNLLRLSKKRDWRKLVISTHQHHQLRCFAQIIALMDEEQWYPYVYNLQGPPIATTMMLKKPVMKGGVRTEDIIGNLKFHTGKEVMAFLQYAEPPVTRPDGSLEYTQNATIAQILEYIEKRDNCLL